MIDRKIFFPIAMRSHALEKDWVPAAFFVIFLSVIFLSFPAWSWLKKFARLADSLRHSSTNRGCGFEQEATEKTERDWQKSKLAESWVAKSSKD